MDCVYEFLLYPLEKMVRDDPADRWREVGAEMTESLPNDVLLEQLQAREKESKNE